MLTLNSNILKIGNKWIIPHSGTGPTPQPTVYQVTTSGTHGTVTASPTEGTTGTEITLSNTPDTHYHFGSYSLTGATLKNANQFDIADSDVSVVGNFVEDTKYSVTCTNDGNGTIAASPTSNYSGSTVTLSNTPNTGYDFDKYTLVSGTGASISGDTLTIGTSNVTVRGDFVAQGATYDAYRILIASDFSGNPNADSGFKTLVGTASPPLRISNLNKTATAGAWYAAGTIPIEDYNLPAMSSSSGLMTTFNVQTMVFETSGGSANVTFDIGLVTVPQSGYTYTGTIVLQGKSGSTYTTLCTKTYTYGINGTSVSLSPEQQPYRQYQLYCETVAVGTDYMMTPVYMNHLTFTPDYMSGQIGSSSSWNQIGTTSTVINQLTSTNNSTYFTYGEGATSAYNGINLRFTSNNKIDSASFTFVKAEYPTGWPYSGYRVNYSIQSLDLYGTASSGSVSIVPKYLKTITQTYVNSWPTNLSISV